MKTSTKHRIDWNQRYEPKERQLHVSAIPGNSERNPMENAITREHIIALHQELRNYGYKYSKNDIVDSYPLGTQTRGQKVVPIVLTYRDEKTMETVRLAAKRARLWYKRGKDYTYNVKNKSNNNYISVWVRTTDG